MAFISRGGRFYRAVIGLSSAVRWAITIGGLGCIAALYIWLIFYPRSTALTYHRSCCNGLQQKKGEFAKKCADSKAVKQDLERVKNSLIHFAADVRKPVQERVANLLAYAQKSELTINNCSVGNAIDKQWYTKQHATMRCTAPLKNIFSFMDTIQTSGQMAQCHTMQLTQQDKDMYDVSFIMRLYEVKEVA